MPDNWWDAAPVAEKGGGNWWDSAPQVAQNFPGKEASFSQGKPESVWHSAWSSVRDAVFGSPERKDVEAINAELEAAGKPGVGLTPTPANMAEYAMVVGSMGGTAAAGASAGAALGRVRGPVGTAARWVAAHPRTAAAATGAVPGALEGNLKEAATGAAVGATLGAGGKGASDLLRTAKDMMSSGRNVEARALLEAARRLAPEAAPAVAAVEKAAAPAVVTAIDRGRAAAGAHKALMDFAKEAARENPKVGQKIWMLLDESGAPTKVLTPDQAGAAARKGLKTTWVKNLWGSAAAAFSE